MLVLSREKSEEIEIHGPSGEVVATITVAEIRGSKVRLGIEAPREYGIFRKEVAEQNRRDQLNQPQA